LDWSIYLQYAVNCVLNGEPIAVDWSGGIADGVCDVSALNPNTIAPGTEEAINAAREKIVSGELYVFTGPLHGVGTDWNGNPIEINLAEAKRISSRPAPRPGLCGGRRYRHRLTAKLCRKKAEPWKRLRLFELTFLHGSWIIIKIRTGRRRLHGDGQRR
jgi:hypothetical protein